MTPGEALDRLPSLGGFELRERLSQGPFSSCYLLHRDRFRVVLRIDGPAARRLGVDRAAEYDLLGVVARAGLGPSPVAVSVPDGLLAWRWLPGRSWQDQDLSSTANLRRLGALLSRVHALGVTGPRRSLAAVARLYAREIGSAPARELARDAGMLDRRLAASGRRYTLCHNDPSAPNIVESNGRLWLIDWEYAAPGDPLFDLAAVTIHHGLPDEAAALLLSAAAGSADEALKIQLGWAAALYDRLLSLWLMLAASETDLDTRQLHQLAAAMRRIEQMRRI